ncbi:hypothetical protein BESB_061960 [Besnoitia besnoiti]|uniref:Oocyst wall protein n=1 Tax=Besnoitia besnoiti TaxID=94643 RepID=A0A2A9MBQ6_BESBE|nr:hypothetical protein BESB_061960 [Besnoitia besnoiti]PFH35309.1 hypothetical protein BESB_061960 [Besnoitia besnoiti]
MGVARKHTNPAVKRTPQEDRRLQGNRFLKAKSRVARSLPLLVFALVLVFPFGVNGKEKKHEETDVEFDVAAPQLSLPSCPDGFAFDRETFRCVQVVSHRPLKKCVVGVLNEDKCLHFVHPLSKTCPPGYHEKFVGDSTPKCAKVNYAQKLLGCHPQEDMIDGLCIRRTYKEIGYVCRKGHLDPENRCVLKQLLPPVLTCPEDYKVLDGACVLYKAISCAGEGVKVEPAAVASSREEILGHLPSGSPHPLAQASLPSQPGSPPSRAADSAHALSVEEAASVSPHRQAGRRGRLVSIETSAERDGRAAHSPGGATSLAPSSLSLHREGVPAGRPMAGSFTGPPSVPYGSHFEEASHEAIAHVHSADLRGWRATEAPAREFLPGDFAPHEGDHELYDAHSDAQPAALPPFHATASLSFSLEGGSASASPSFGSDLPVWPSPRAADGLGFSSDSPAGLSVLTLLRDGSVEESLVPLVSLHDSTSEALLLPDAPYLVQERAPAAGAEKLDSRESSLWLAPSQSTAASPHAFLARPSAVRRAEAAPSREDDQRGVLVQEKSGVSLRERTRPADATRQSSSGATAAPTRREETSRTRQGRESKSLLEILKKTTESGLPRRLLGGPLHTPSTLDDHCFEITRVDASRKCPYDFTLEIYKDDTMNSPVLVCLGSRILPSEAVCAGRIVGSRCLVETRTHAKWFCPLDVHTEEPPKAKKPKPLPPPSPPAPEDSKKAPASHTGKRPERMEAKEVPGKDKSDKEEASVPSSEKKRGSSPTFAEVKTTDKSPKTAGTATTNKERAETPNLEEREREQTEGDPKGRHLASTERPSQNGGGETGTGEGRAAQKDSQRGASHEEGDGGEDDDEASRRQVEQTSLSSSLRQLGRLPFALLLMEINERRRTSDPKQRMKEEVEQMKQARHAGAAVVRPSPPPSLPPGMLPFLGENEKKTKDLKTKKLTDTVEAPPTGLCYREQIVDQIVVCPNGYNVTPAQVCAAVSAPVLTCHAGFKYLPEGLCVQYVYSELVDILGLHEPNETKPKILNKLKKS